jgi:hypothetical protein
MVDRPTWKRSASSFSLGIMSPGFQTPFMMRSVKAFTISCGRVARAIGRMRAAEFVMRTLYTLAESSNMARHDIEMPSRSILTAPSIERYS